jgi:Fe2+ transport system protein FeoA
MKLSALTVGKTAIIKAIGGSGELRYRLLEMGIVPGVKVLIERTAPFGGPLVLVVQRYTLSIRREDADTIDVLPVVKEKK